MSFPPLQNDLILRAATGEQVERTPVWIMRQAGRYMKEFREVCRTPELACQVTLQPIDYFDGLLDASIIFSDILVIPQALGLEVQMKEGTGLAENFNPGPHFPDPIRTVEDLNRIKKRVDVAAELGYVFEAITLTRMRLNGRVPLIGFAGAPWTLMAYMIEGGGSKTLSKAKSWLYKHPKESHWLLQRTTDTIVDFLIGQVKAGAQIASRVKSALIELDMVVPMVIFAKGAHDSLDLLAGIGYDVVGLDWSIDPVHARSVTRGRVTLQGNADPCLLYASPDVIKKEVKVMLSKFGSRGHIANLGHGMMPDHDPEHLRVYLQAIREFSTVQHYR